MSEVTVSREFGLGVASLYSDDRLARQAARGDEGAFAAIFRRYHQGLYRLCLAIVGNPADAQDALQNTMVKVLQALPGEERRIELEPWLYRIAHNESVELLRHRLEPRPLDAEQAAPGSGLAEEAASRERLEWLIADLEELPERQRGALVMRELAGLEFAEIGVALGTSAAVARQTLYEARLSLRQMDEGREMSCEWVTRALSDGDGRVTRRRDVRAHLRSCGGCRHFRDDIEARERDFAALSPLPAVAAAGILQGRFGGGGGGGGGTLAAALGGGVAKSAGSAAALKAAAVVAAVGAIGVGVADRGGLIDLGLPGGSGSEATQAQRPARAELARAYSAGAPAFAGSTRATEGMARGIDDGWSEASTTEAGRDGDAGVPGAMKVETPAEARAGTDKAANPVTPAPASGPEELEKVAAGEDPSPTPGPSADESDGDGDPGGNGGNGNGKAKGKDHEKDLPIASEHGQQTAAEKKGAEHPAHPSNPGSEKEKEKGKEKAPPSSPPEAGLPEEPSQPPPSSPPAKEGSPGHGEGKKPHGLQ
jgi:RNA polymerase sigma factor (sigma-70 family)